MKPILPFVTILSFFICPFLYSQNLITEIYGIINDFTKVTAISTCNSELTVTSIQGFEPGIAVVLIQTKGASIKSNNNNAFGEIETLHNTGKYETNVVQSVSGNTLFLKHEIVNEYDLMNGTVQLVTMPSYEDAEVSNLLTTIPWNGNTGGILAFKVTNVLTLNADIDVSGKGFRGGEMVSVADNNCTGGFNNADNFFYETGNWRGAHKGEGIANILSGKELGKGPQANGGGGGNDHNSGGGGGAHVARGGNGGERKTPIFTTSCKGQNPGLKGNAIPEIENRIFFGGGGGAGHTNNQAGSGGGNGGGIIIIQAKTIIANNHRIMANGITLPLVVEQDGAGGGGAGGTIILDAESVIGQLVVDAKGGDGSTIILNNSSECFGPGGGGAGGRFISSLPNTNIQVNIAGGTPGTSSSNNINECTNVTNGAQNGENGIQTSFTGIAQGEGTGGPVMILDQPEAVFYACYNMPTVIEISTQGLNVEYQWQVNQGSGFNDLEDNDIYSGTNTPTLTISEIEDNMLGYTYILVVNSICSSSNAISNFFRIELINAPVPNFDYIVNGRQVTFNNLSQHEDDIHWDFGTGETSSTENPIYTFDEDGQYYVTLTVSNGCGTFEISKFVSIGTSPTAAFEMNQTAGCAPLTIEFTNQSSSNASGFFWIFEGGTPATSTAQNPVVSYQSGGSYNVTLIAGNETGNDTLEMVDVVNINAGPNTAFFVDVNELEVSFNNTTGDGMTYLWDFGDNMGNSIEANPTYTYTEEGEYTATLIATNECGSRTYSLNFTTGSLPNAGFTASTGVGCSPLVVEYNNQSSGTNVGDWLWTFEGGNPSTSTEQNPVVSYELAGSYKTTLTANNNLGSNTVTKEDFVIVYDQPDANFTYDINDGVVTFMGNGDHATTYGWNFGDGNFSNELNPVHVYANSGVHAVTFTATNPSCGNSVTKIINITLSSLDKVEAVPEIIVYPNPTKGQIIVSIEHQPLHEVQLQLYNVNGQLLSIVPQQIGNALEIDLVDVPQGIYFLKIIAEEWQTIRKVTKTGGR